MTTLTDINQLQVRKGCRDIEAIRVTEAYWVQHDLLAPDKSVCVYTRTNRHSRRSSDVVSRKLARLAYDVW